MDALLKTFGAATLVATAAAMAQAPASGPITSAGAAMRYYQSLENRVPAPRLWLAAPAPFGQPRAVSSGDSADQLLDQIVSGYTRHLLDRGTWINPLVRPIGPAAAPAQTSGYRSWFDWPEPGLGAGDAANAGLAGPSPR